MVILDVIVLFFVVFICKMFCREIVGECDKLKIIVSENVLLILGIYEVRFVIVVLGIR